MEGRGRSEVDPGLDELDLVIRGGLARSFEHDESPVAVLHRMKPALRRARRRRRLNQVALTAAACIALGAAGAMLVRSELPLSGTITMAGETGSTDEGPAAGSDDDHDGLVVHGTTSVAGEPSTDRSSSDGDSAVADDQDQEPESAGRGSGDGDEPDTTTSTRAPATTSSTGRPTTTTAPSDGDSTSSSVRSDGAIVIGSECGLTVVRQDGSMVNLVSTEPGPGVRVEVKSSGPDQVEVGFEGSAGQCELKIRVGRTGLEIVREDHGDSEDHN